MKRTQLISAFLSLAALWGVQTGSAAAQSAANAKPAYLDAGRAEFRLCMAQRYLLFEGHAREGVFDPLFDWAPGI